MVDRTDAGRARYVAHEEPDGPWAQLPDAVKLMWERAAERDRQQMLRDIQSPRGRRRR